jgi:hypothetical protein
MTLRTGEQYVVETLDHFLNRLDATVIEIAQACINEGVTTEDQILESAREHEEMIDEDPINTPNMGDAGVEDIRQEMLYEVIYHEFWPQGILHTLETREGEYTHTRSQYGVHRILRLHAQEEESQVEPATPQ